MREKCCLNYFYEKDLAIGLITEASELLEHFRWKTEEQMKEVFSNREKKEKVVEEVGDVLYMLLRFCQMNEIDVSTALNKKLELTDRRYPVEKVKGSNKKYTEY